MMKWFTKAGWPWLIWLYNKLVDSASDCLWLITADYCNIPGILML